MRKMLRRAVIAIALTLIGLGAYTYGFAGPVSVAPQSAAVSILKFPERTFRYSAPFFFEADTTHSLYASSAPPNALAPGDRVWEIVSAGQEIHLVEASGDAFRENFRPLPNGIDEAAGAGNPERCASDGMDLGSSGLGPDLGALGLRFRGVRFRKPVLVLFSSSGASSRGVRLAEVYFGERSVDVCALTKPPVSFRQRLWNVPSAVRLPDLAYVDLKRRLLFVTADAADRGTIAAMRY
ncbi:MAG TPA: hypothetical protein VIX89_06520 [Bryobacteraceae bacterium]